MTRPPSATAARPARRTPAGDDGAALLTVLLIILVVGTLSTLVLANVVSQVRPSVFEKNSSRAVFAAEAGIQAGLAQVRTAVGTSGSSGDVRRLPCSLAGDAGSATAPLPFEVTVRYYATDPAGRDAAWRAANAMACTATGTTTVPGYAVIASTGADAATVGNRADRGRRTLESVYVFTQTNANVAGGLFWTFSQQFCLDAASQASGSRIVYRPKASCTSGTPTQMWVYDTDYAIKLASTISTATPLCLTGPFTSSSTAELRPCNGAATQKFSYEGEARLRGQNAANTDYSGNCLWAGATTGLSGRNLQVGSGGCSSVNEDWGSFAPEPRVGAGAASYTTRQIVSYLEFGRCFDVTGESTAADAMILYPCKQDPSPGGSKLKWNHKWYYQEPTGTATSTTGPISIFDAGGTQFCLQVPSAATKPGHVVLSACTGAANQRFTRTGDTGSYATSYTFTTADSRCLGIGPIHSAGVPFSTIIAAPCTGGTEQKWNAPPNAVDSAVTGTFEHP